MTVTSDTIFDVGQYLYRRRKTVGKTMLDIEHTHGVSHSTVDDIESGKTKPLLYTLVLICEALGLEVVIREKQR